jgi:hypothetical protein
MNHIEEYFLNELVNVYISEEDFASNEIKNGKRLHKNDGIWWVEKASFYYRPLNIMHIHTPKKITPDSLKAFLGYSFRVDEPNKKGYNISINVLQGENLQGYNLKKLPPPKQRIVKQGLKNCNVRVIRDITPYILEMKSINIDQAERFDNLGDKKDYLPASYYNEKENQWREEIVKSFSHVGHFMIGAFVGDKLAAYIDLVILDNIWEFGAVKSHSDYFPYRPVDALYYYILHTASLNSHCKYVINGGGEDERESLTKYKTLFLLQPTTIYYYTHSFIPYKLFSFIKQLIK